MPRLMHRFAPLIGIAAGLAAILIALRLLPAPLFSPATLLPPPSLLPPLSPEAFAQRYATALPAPTGPLSTYHLGHSLVGRDMPAMLAQLAGHTYASQIGWGASLKDHWQGRVPGLAEENRAPAFRPAAGAIDSGAYGAVILTEMVELRDAIRWHDSAAYLAGWAARARNANPDTRIYLFETWHRLDDPQGWLARLDADLARHWEGDLLRPAMAGTGAAPGVGTGAAPGAAPGAATTANPAASPPTSPPATPPVNPATNPLATPPPNPAAPTIHLIPGGQVMAEAARAIEAGLIPGLTSRRDLFARLPDGTTDLVHPGDIGAYLMALTHYAVLYHRSPEGLPHQLARADGSPAHPPTREAALLLQQLVWRVVTRYPATGVAQTTEAG